MKATITPLKGKYYGTKVLIEQDNGYFGCMKLWGALRNGTPSIREYEQLTCKGDVTKCNSTWALCGGYCEAIDSSHYEDAGDYELAQFIVQQINEEYKK